MKKTNPPPLSHQPLEEYVTLGKENKFPEGQRLDSRTVECVRTFGKNFLMRHGAYERIKQISNEEWDGPLTQEGRQQMIDAAKLMSSYLPTFVRLLVAPRERNRESAEILKEELLNYNIFVTCMEENDLLTQVNFKQFTKDIWGKLGETDHVRIILTAQHCIEMYSVMSFADEFTPANGDVIAQKGQIISTSLN